MFIDRFKNSAGEIKNSFKGLKGKIIVIFLSVAVLQTISWYFTSRRFYNSTLYYYFYHDGDEQLYSYLYWFLSDCVTLLFIPLLIIKLVFKEKIISYGVSFGDYKTGLPLTLICIIPMIIIIWLISGLPDFSSVYPQLQSAKENWTVFVIFELALLIYMFAWEFFWRGFMLFGLKSEFGYYSIFIQMIPFVILHNGKPFLETFSAILGGIILGVIALKTRSYIYGVLIHYSIIFSLDLFSIIRYRTGDLVSNFNNLANKIIN